MTVSYPTLGARRYETSYKDNLRSINEAVQRGDLSKEVSSSLCEPMLDFIIEDSIVRVIWSLMTRSSAAWLSVICPNRRVSLKSNWRNVVKLAFDQSDFHILHDEGDKEEKKDKVDACQRRQDWSLIIVYSMLLTALWCTSVSSFYLVPRSKASQFRQTLNLEASSLQGIPLG